MDRSVDLVNTSLSFPAFETGVDIDAMKGLICIGCDDDCQGCQDTCVKCQGTCEKKICG